MKQVYGFNPVTKKQYSINETNFYPDKMDDEIENSVKAMPNGSLMKLYM